MVTLCAGLGPMPWTINSEIYPMWARGTGNAIATMINWAFNLVVSFTFLTMLENITKYGKYTEGGHLSVATMNLNIREIDPMTVVDGYPQAK